MDWNNVRENRRVALGKAKQREWLDASERNAE